MFVCLGGRALSAESSMLHGFFKSAVKEQRWNQIQHLLLHVLWAHKEIIINVLGRDRHLTLCYNCYNDKRDETKKREKDEKNISHLDSYCVIVIFHSCTRAKKQLQAHAATVAVLLKLVTVSAPCSWVGSGLYDASTTKRSRISLCLELFHCL